MLFNNNYKLMHKNTYGGLTVVILHTKSLWRVLEIY